MQIGKIVYNASAEAFEARVDVERDGRTFKYPCAVSGPVTMNESDVRVILNRQACQMSAIHPNLYSHT